MGMLDAGDFLKAHVNLEAELEAKEQPRRSSTISLPIGSTFIDSAEAGSSQKEMQS